MLKHSYDNCKSYISGDFTTDLQSILR